MPTVYWDVETYCDLSLTEHGAYLYARHSSTCPLVLGYAVDADEVRTWAPDDPPPAIFLEAAEHPNDFWSVSDNWTFENLILEYVLIPRHGFRPLPIERQDCAQRLALANGYPAELGLRCEALGLPYRKDPEARRAMLRISRPKTAKSRRKAENTEQYQADLALVIERCKTDVASTRAAYNAPQLTRLSADERQVLLVDAAINRRGIRANIPFLTAAREMTVRERNNINARLDELTCGAINSVDQRDRILKAVNERGHHLSSLTKRSVAAALAHQPDNYVQELLTLRQQGAFASVRKFKTFLNFADPEDRRVRDTLRYCGSATGRWSSLKPQLQNLKRNDAELPAFLVDAIIAGNRDTLVRFGNPLTLMGELSRAGLCADSGNVLMSGDLSAIESRILSWKAGEQWKPINEYYILNRAGMIITTNYRDALKLPAGDRRHYVTFSERRSEEFSAEYWNEFWTWYEAGGFAHVAALLYQRDLSGFDPKAEPPKTPAFRYMVTASRGAGYNELADAIDALGNPQALTINELMVKAPGLEWLRDVPKRGALTHRITDCNYVAIDNPTAKDGLWKINDRRQTVYVHLDVPPDQRIDAATAHRDQLNANTKKAVTTSPTGTA